MIKRGKGKQRLSLLSLSELTFGARGVNSSAYVDAVVPLHFYSLSLATLFFLFVATPGGVQGHVFIGLQSTINHSNHSREIGDPPPHRP